MDGPAQGIRKTAHLSASYSLQDCRHDRSYGECSELVREYHIPDDAYGELLSTLAQMMRTYRSCRRISSKRKSSQGKGVSFFG